MTISYNSQTRIPKFGAASTRAYRSSSALSLEQIINIAPSVAKVEAHESRSARYEVAPTSDVVTALMREGWQCHEVRQAGSRIPGKAEFTKHLLRLRHASAAQAQVGGLFPEIVLVNSHDGTSSYQLGCGLFRLVCSNGLVVSEGEHTSARISHTRGVRDNIIEASFRILENSPAVIEQTREFSALQLTDGERRAFAVAALEMRYQPDEGDRPPIAPELALNVRRVADSGNDLFQTLNVVQENLTQGGQPYRTTRAGRSSVARTREVRGIDANVGLNRALWRLAEEMKKLKA